MSTGSSAAAVAPASVQVVFSGTGILPVSASVPARYPAQNAARDPVEDVLPKYRGLPSAVL